MLWMWISCRQKMHSTSFLLVSYNHHKFPQYLEKEYLVIMKQVSWPCILQKLNCHFPWHVVKMYFVIMFCENEIPHYYTFFSYHFNDDKSFKFLVKKDMFYIKTQFILLYFGYKRVIRMHSYWSKELVSHLLLLLLNDFQLFPYLCQFLSLPSP